MQKRHTGSAGQTGFCNKVFLLAFFYIYTKFYFHVKVVLNPKKKNIAAY